MRPQREREQDQPQRELFQVELEQISDLDHPLVHLGMCTDWASFEQTLGVACHFTPGALGISTRLMVALKMVTVRPAQLKRINVDSTVQNRAPATGLRRWGWNTRRFVFLPARGSIIAAGNGW